jgi:hypothetical protein
VITGMQLRASRSAGGAVAALMGVCCYYRGGEGAEKVGSVYFEEKDQVL